MPGLEKYWRLSPPGDGGGWEMVQRTYVMFCLWGLVPTSGVLSYEDLGPAATNGISQERKGVGEEPTELMVGVEDGAEKKRCFSYLPALCGLAVQRPVYSGAREGPGVEWGGCV